MDILKECLEASLVGKDRIKGNVVFAAVGGNHVARMPMNVLIQLESNVMKHCSSKWIVLGVINLCIQRVHHQCCFTMFV